MGFFSSLTGQFRSVVEWKDADPNLLIWQWNGSNDELKNASKLIINPGQAAIFVYEGSIKAIHDYSGMFDLKTANIPFWTTITKFMQAFTSEHKANIYFVRLTTFLNQKWGTKAPIKYEDPVYKFPVGMRAFGNFSFRITDIRRFFTEFASNTSEMPISFIRTAIVDRIIEPLSEVFAKSGFSYAEIDKHRVEISKNLREQVAPEFGELGFELEDFRIENTDFDEKTQERIDKISDKVADVQAINAMGSLNVQSLNSYATIERLNALKLAAENPGGAAGVGVGMGAGVGLGAGLGMGGLGMAGGFAMPIPPQQATVRCACGAYINQSAKFCPECGKPQGCACPKCGAKLNPGTKFCSECGSQL